MVEEKICSVCGITFRKKTVYCSASCYYKAPVSEETRRRMSKANKGKPKSLHMREALSKSTKGKPKPHMLGENNPNYGGVYSNDPVIYEKFLKAVKLRGQTWGDEQKRNHSLKMLGDSNAMRGKNHTEEYKQRLSKTVKQKYIDGLVKITIHKISKPEREIADKLKNLEIDFNIQFHIPGIPYWYDFYLPKYNLIVEFQGDYWHANPEKYKSGTEMRFRGVIKLVDDIWNKDKLKKEAAEGAGYKFLSIWESDYKINGINALEKYIYEL